MTDTRSNDTMRAALVWIEKRCRVHSDSAADVVNDVLRVAAETLARVDGHQDERQTDTRASLVERHTELSTRIHEALDRGDRRTAERLEAHRTRIARRLIGLQPIIGVKHHG